MTTPPGPRLDSRLGNPDWVDNWTIGPGLRMEIIDRDRRVWLSQEPVTKEQAGGLSLPPDVAPALFGAVIADGAYFNRSPGATVDGPLEAREIDGLRFSFVARPVGQRRLEGATLMSIDKHHTMLYAAGRTIEVLDFGDGTFAPPAWSGPDREPSEPSDRAPSDREPGQPAESGWLRRNVTLTNDLIAVIPNPADVVIFDDGSGFHGPLSISELESACR